MLLERVANRVNRFRYSPRIQIDESPDVLSLGSDYGVCFIQDAPDLYGATIISCGLGEDATFDVEFLHRFGGKVIMVDPTPRAIDHYEAMRARFGLSAERPHVSGSQPPESYDLRGIKSEDLVLEPVALWTADMPLRFYAPPNPAHVSHSITNVQNHYRRDTPSIEVKAETLVTIMARHGITELSYLKLDIEGAEIPVLTQILSEGPLPRQMHIGFDDLNVPTRSSMQAVEAMDGRLRSRGYRCLQRIGQNFLYVRD